MEGREQGHCSQTGLIVLNIKTCQESNFQHLTFTRLLPRPMGLCFPFKKRIKSTRTFSSGCEAITAAFWKSLHYSKLRNRKSFQTFQKLCHTVIHAAYNICLLLIFFWLSSQVSLKFRQF